MVYLQHELFTVAILKCADLACYIRWGKHRMMRVKTHADRKDPTGLNTAFNMATNTANQTGRLPIHSSIDLSLPLTNNSAKYSQNASPVGWVWTKNSRAATKHGKRRKHTNFTKK